MYILGLFSWAASEIWGKVREVFFMLDMVPYFLIDNVYNLFYEVSTQNLITETVVNQVLSNVYVLVGIFAFFRIALLLINSIINPDALNKEGVGLSRIFVNTIIMLVLLVFTPTLFSMSRTFAKEVVEGNYIQKLFINVDDSKNIAEPGDEMQRISIAAVLTLDEAVENDKTYQSGKTEKAIQCLNNVNSIGENDTSTEAAKLGEGSKECMDNGKVKWSKVASYNSAKTNTNDGKVYVYSYKPLVLTVTGWVIVYVLLSFTFDVAKRVIELAILEIVSPLFIATIVDPKSMQTGPFKRWLKTLGNSYASLFLRVAAISIMLLCVKLLSYWKPSANVGAFGKLIILIAFLIFIKQLPKWFSNMIGMDGDGTGLGSLGIGKKIGGAALVGGLATMAGHGLAGAAVGAAVAGHNQLRNRRAARRELRDQAGLNKGIGKKARAARNAWYAENGNADKYADMSRRQAIRAARSEAYAAQAAGGSKAGLKAGAKQFGASMAAGVIGGGRAGVSADNLKGAFTGSVKAANQFGQQVGLKGEGIGQRIVNATDNAYIGLKGAYGTAAEINKKIGDAEDNKKFNSWFSDSFKRNNSVEDTALSQKSFNQQFLGASGDDSSPMYAALALKNDKKLKNAKITTGDDGIITVSNDNFAMKVDGKNGQILNDDGTVAMDGNNYTNMVQSGKNIFGNSQEGIANYEYMWAEAQRQAINSTIGNNSQMSALMQQRTSAEQSIAYNQSEATKMVSAAGLVAGDGTISLDGSKINLGDATMDQLKRLYLNSAATNEYKDRMNQMASSTTSSQNIINQLNTQIDYYQASNDKLKNMVDSLRSDGNENSTLDELLVKAEKIAEKQKKAADAYEIQKKETT